MTRKNATECSMHLFEVFRIFSISYFPCTLRNPNYIIEYNLEYFFKIRIRNYLYLQRVEIFEKEGN